MTNKKQGRKRYLALGAPVKYLQEPLLTHTEKMGLLTYNTLTLLMSSTVWYHVRHFSFKPTVETYQTPVREPVHDKSHSRINIQTLGIGLALCANRANYQAVMKTAF